MHLTVRVFMNLTVPSIPHRTVQAYLTSQSERTSPHSPSVPHLTVQANLTSQSEHLFSQSKRLCTSQSSSQSERLQSEHLNTSQSERLSSQSKQLSSQSERLSSQSKQLSSQSEHLNTSQSEHLCTSQSECLCSPQSPNGVLITEVPLYSFGIVLSFVERSSFGGSKCYRESNHLGP